MEEECILYRKPIFDLTLDCNLSVWFEKDSVVQLPIASWEQIMFTPPSLFLAQKKPPDETKMLSG